MQRLLEPFSVPNAAPMGRSALLALLLLPVQTAGLGTSSCMTSREEVSVAAASLERWQQQLDAVQKSLRDARRVLSAKQLELAGCESSNANTPPQVVETKAIGHSDVSAQPLGQPSDARRYRERSTACGSGPDDDGIGMMDAPKQQLFGARCWEANASFSDPSACGCFNTPRHPEFDTRLRNGIIIRIVVGTWKAASLDSWLLKFVIEQEMGYPVKLFFASKYCENDDIYRALGKGDLHMYPEVRCRAHGQLSHPVAPVGALIRRSRGRLDFYPYTTPDPTLGTAPIFCGRLLTAGVEIGGRRLARRVASETRGRIHVAAGRPGRPGGRASLQGTLLCLRRLCHLGLSESSAGSQMANGKWPPSPLPAYLRLQRRVSLGGARTARDGGPERTSTAH